MNRFLSTYSDVLAGKGTPADANKAAIALALFPTLVTKAEVALKEVEKPNLLPLVMEKEVLLAQLNAAERDIATGDALIALRQDHVDALLAQLDAYGQARTAVASFSKAGSVTDTTMLGALQPAVGEKDPNVKSVRVITKANLWKATSLFLDAEGRLRADVAKTRYRITALAHEKALTYAEANIYQWKALIDPSVELMSMYGASGLRSSDLTALLNSLTLLWIAVGVN